MFEYYKCYEYHEYNILNNLGNVSILALLHHICFSKNPGNTVANQYAFDIKAE
jgi:hypothetical protein